MKWIIPSAVLVFACIVCMSDTRKRYGGGGKDRVDDLYAELVDRNSELKQLEKDLQNAYKNADDAEDRFGSYNLPSSEYYASATAKANLIHDAELKTKVNTWIDASKAQYAQRIMDLTNLLKMMKEKKISADDYHYALKIGLTLPVIEKYQQQSMPSDAEIKAAINQLNESIQKMQSLNRK